MTLVKSLYSGDPDVMGLSSHVKKTTLRYSAYILGGAMWRPYVDVPNIY